MEEKEKCPLCQSTELRWGQQDGEAVVTKVGTFLFGIGTKILHLCCINCGHVVRSKLENPSVLK
jgi:hypothetical protein